MGLKDRNELKGKLLGIEVEYYPGNYPERKRDDLIEVEQKGDGSLRAGGIEMTALTWASDGNRLRGLLGLNLSGRVDRRCGLHVHVDVRHLGQGGLLSAEETFDKVCELHNHIRFLCPRSRWMNRYCEWVNNRPGATNFREPAQGSRYAAVNWMSYSIRKTFEFRCQGGSTNVYKIEMWALVCQHLVNWCAQPHNKITGSHRYFDYFMAIFPEPLRSWVALRKAKMVADENGQVLDQERLMRAMGDVAGEVPTQAELDSIRRGMEGARNGRRQRNRARRVSRALAQGGNGTDVVDAMQNGQAPAPVPYHVQVAERNARRRAQRAAAREAARLAQIDENRANRANL